jgi:sugar transferase EpsL
MKEDRLRGGLYRRHGKRLLDVVVATVVGILFAPVAVIVAILVRWKMGGPVLFCQNRPGKGGQPFTIYKFRTMNDAMDENGDFLPDAERLTALGRWLRSTSIDELPELINVLKGDMSLVGPRPLLMHYLERYTPEQARRHEVRPGITGWAQVNGRNALSWQRKFELDVWYVDHLSLGLDITILARTVSQVLRRTGISQPGAATAREFRGDQDG